MARLNGNLKSLVTVKGDKREQLPPPQDKGPKQEPVPTKQGSSPGAKSLRSSAEPHVATRLLLPESLKFELDQFFLERKMKGKNEFLIAAIRSHLKAQKRESSKLS